MSDLTDEDFDDMHHAIGRKTIKDAYRNYYCTQVDRDIAKRFEATGCWDLRTKINDGRDAIYSVNRTGLAELEKWLADSCGRNAVTDLLPCPFCGSEPQLLEEHPFYTVQCTHYYCQAGQIALQNADSAIDRWNKRVALSRGRDPYPGR